MKHSLIKFTLLLLIIGLLTNPILAQSDSNKVKYGLWFTPTYVGKIFGITVGPLGSEVLCDKPYTQKSNGLNIQLLGQGFIQTLYVGNKNYINGVMQIYKDSTRRTYKKRVLHNGILLSTLGTFTEQINGISISPWMSTALIVNGLSSNLLWNLNTETNGVSLGAVNHSGKMRGAQIGLFNKSNNLRGIQIGLWNINEKRSLPFLNWNFKKKNPYNSL